MQCCPDARERAGPVSPTQFGGGGNTVQAQRARVRWDNLQWIGTLPAGSLDQTRAARV